MRRPMEREKELPKLINVLRRTSRMALQSEWTGGSQDAAVFCTEQYNRVLARLMEIDDGIGTIFEPLPAGSSLTVVAMACRQLAAYYEDELLPHTSSLILHPSSFILRPALCLLPPVFGPDWRCD